MWIIRGESLQTNKQTFIYYSRAFGVVCILACHLCTVHSSAYVQMLAQIFNVGVELFIIISGFCFGLQGSIRTPMKWYSKRAGRILPSYELFLSILALVYILQNLSFPLIQWLTCIFGVQGAVVGVLGAEQTWFITPLLIGYLLTPLLSTILDKTTDRTIYIKIASVVFLLVPCILVFFPVVSIFTVGVQVCFYCISYVLGRTYDTWKLMLTPGVRYMVIMVFAFAIRLAGRILWDGSRIYDCIVVGYTQYIVAICVFLLFWSFLNERNPGAIVQWICNISFEVYLYHYMFIVGPLSIMSVTNSWIINSALIVLITAIVATLANKAVSYVKQKGNLYKTSETIER